jgi:hypothetical protein
MSVGCVRFVSSILVGCNGFSYCCSMILVVFVVDDDDVAAIVGGTYR